MVGSVVQRVMVTTEMTVAYICANGIIKEQYRPSGVAFQYGGSTSQDFILWIHYNIEVTLNIFRTGAVDVDDTVVKIKATMCYDPPVKIRKARTGKMVKMGRNADSFDMSKKHWDGILQSTSIRSQFMTRYTVKCAKSLEISRSSRIHEKNGAETVSCRMESAGLDPTDARFIVYSFEVY